MPKLTHYTILPYTSHPNYRDDLTCISCGAVALPEGRDGYGDHHEECDLIGTLVSLVSYEPNPDGGGGIATLIGMARTTFDAADMIFRAYAKRHGMEWQRENHDAISRARFAPCPVATVETSVAYLDGAMHRWISSSYVLLDPSGKIYGLFSKEADAIEMGFLISPLTFS